MGEGLRQAAAATARTRVRMDCQECGQNVHPAEFHSPRPDKGDTGEKRTVNYVRDEATDTVWPVPHGAEWVLRYGTPEGREAQRMGVASIIAAYEYLTNPHLPQYAAIDALKRARKASASGRSDDRD